MTSLSTAVEKLRQKEPAPVGVSLEVFPAKDEDGLVALAALARRLEPFAPEYISVTYGAGGSSRERTLATIEALRAATNTPIAAHLTVVNASREETMAVAERFRAAGVDHIVALRGDPPDGASHFAPHPQGFANAAELVGALRERWPDLRISVAAYPEGHPESPSRAADLANLKAKFEAGADEALTQFFFDNTLFSDFLEEARAAGIAGDIHPGIMLIPNFFQVRNFAERCKASVPEWLSRRFAGLKGRKDGDSLLVHRMLAAAFAVEQVLDLAARGVRHFHLYTMNRPQLAEAVCRALLGGPDGES